MPSNDEKRTRKKRNGMTGRGGEGVESIVDPVERDDPKPSEPPRASAGDGVDQFLSDDGGVTVDVDAL